MTWEVRVLYFVYIWIIAFNTAPCLKYKVVQIWPGLFTFVYTQISPGHIWTTLYFHHHHLPPWIRSFDLFRPRRIAIVSWGVHDLFFLEVCSWGRLSGVWCYPFFQDGWSSLVCLCVFAYEYFIFPGRVTNPSAKPPFLEDQFVFLRLATLLRAVRLGRPYR